MRSAVIEHDVRVKNRRLAGGGVVSRVQPRIADGVIHPAVAVEVGCRDRAPPAGAGGCKAESGSRVFEACAADTSITGNRSPVVCDEKVGPTVAVDIAPERRCCHSPRGKHRRQLACNIDVAAVAPGKQRASGRIGILSRHDSPADKDSEVPRELEVGSRNGSDADRQFRKRSRWSG